MPPLRIEISEIYDASFKAAADKHGGVMPVARVAVKFARWKQDQAAPPCPFSDDKQSGTRSDGTVFAPYRNLGLRHCHLDITGADPMIAYRLFPDDGNGDRLLMLCA